MVIPIMEWTTLQRNVRLNGTYHILFNGLISSKKIDREMTVVPEEATTGRVRISGMVLKGSDVVSAIACRRHGVLEEDVFKSFRQMEDKEPSAVYPLHPRCEVSGLEQREILIRAKGKNTFVAYVAGKYEKIEGVGHLLSLEYLFDILV